MKYLLSALMCFTLMSCSSTPKVPKVPELKTPPLFAKLEVGEIKDRSINTDDLFDTKTLKAPPTPLAVVRVKNHMNTDRIQWFTATLPVAKGVVFNEQLRQISTHHGAVSASAIKWHYDGGEAHSIAIVKVKFPLYMTAGQEIEVPFYIDAKSNPLPFAFGPLLSGLLKHDLHDLMFIGLKLKNDPKIYYAPMWQNPKVLESSTHSYTFRWQSNFTSGANKLGMTANYAMTINNRQDFGDLVFSFGHNDFDILKSGGYDVEWARLYHKQGFKVDIRNMASYGASRLQPQNGFGVIELLTDQNISDGSARTFRGMYGLVADPNSLNGKSYRAELKYPGFGMAKQQYWVSSKAGGIVGNVMPARGTFQQMVNSVRPMCDQAYDVKITANGFHMANKAPFQTGDQPAFSSNMPAFQQQAILTESSCPIQWALHGAQVEEYRHSYFWKDGRRMHWLDTPKTCFFWSGRPHYHHSHWSGGHCDQWKSRSTHTGFDIGTTYGVATEDDQHWGNPLLHGAYELSGDPWMKNLMEYRMTLALWNKLGDYSWHSPGRIGSERAVRVANNATQLVTYFPDHPITQELKPRLALHIRSRIQGDFRNQFPWDVAGIDDWHKWWGVYGLESVYGDNRHPVFTGTTPGAQCVTGRLCEENRGMISWWTGFSMTFAYQMIKTGIAPIYGQEFINKYMDMGEFYFKQDGQNRGGRRLNDWNVTESPFTQSWHSGWLSAVEAYGKSHPKWSFFRDKVVPTREWMFSVSRPGDLWSGHDKWYQ